jgi:hypothetical protein
VSLLQSGIQTVGDADRREHRTRKRVGQCVTNSVSYACWARLDGLKLEFRSNLPDETRTGRILARDG